MITRILTLFSAVSNKQEPSGPRPVRQMVRYPFNLPSFQNLHFLPIKSLQSQPLYVFSPLRKTSIKLVVTQKNQLKRLQ
jgi:hypothetical protein